MKVLFIIAILILLGLQYRLWIGEGSLAHLNRLKKDIAMQEIENSDLRERNRILEAEVKALKHDINAIEEKARVDLGMVKQGETFFMFVDELEKSADE